MTNCSQFPDEPIRNDEPKDTSFIRREAEALAEEVRMQLMFYLSEMYPDELRAKSGSLRKSLNGKIVSVVEIAAEAFAKAQRREVWEEAAALVEGYGGLSIYAQKTPAIIAQALREQAAKEPTP